MPTQSTTLLSEYPDSSLTLAASGHANNTDILALRRTYSEIQAREFILATYATLQFGKKVKSIFPLSAVSISIIRRSTPFLLMM